MLNDPQLWDHFLSNPDIHQLCVRLWSLKIQDVDEHRSLSLDRPSEYLVYVLPGKVGTVDFCPIIWTMWTITKQPYSRDTFLRLWHRHCTSIGLDSSAVMAESILSRISLLQVALKKRPAHLDVFWEKIWYMGCLLIAFAPRDGVPIGQVVYCQRVLAELDKRNYILHFTRLLRTVSDQSLSLPYSPGRLTIKRFVGTGHTVALPLACLNFVVTVLLKDASRLSTSLFSHYTEFIKGGILHIAANCSHFLTTTSHPQLRLLRQDLEVRYYAPLCADIATLVTSHSVYPPVLRALCHSLHHHPLTEIQLVGLDEAMRSYGVIVQREPDGNTPMAEVREGILASYDIYKYLRSDPLPDICDYEGHVEIARTYRKGRVCSGCQFAFYCSRRCQEQDWELHRHECRQSRRQRQESKSRHDWIRPSWRKYHVSRLLDHYAMSDMHKQSAPISRLNCANGLAE
ncbi:hypothetical protein BKA70DRAFT_593031 [Coprinopsis sp. MPI-PUGE-AT-0042]|nr:hypothetical protein BKA70DRAFT_593031 [Coprinopsis sp. MPI-PUGE-AT-0042]